MTEKRTLTMKKTTLTIPKETPVNLRYVDKKGRYILQERIDNRWRDVPLVGSLSDDLVVSP